ncbi:hypothetical protein HNR29_005452 [Rhizobium leguminosarum]|nr:hypothetical protein [Rhizobium leguminosarum]
MKNVAPGATKSHGETDFQNRLVYQSSSQSADIGFRIIESYQAGRGRQGS